ncbi:MAG: DUF4197 domain-containing protein [Candidatus Omnitrophota bacterium]
MKQRTLCLLAMVMSSLFFAVNTQAADWGTWLKSVGVDSSASLKGTPVGDGLKEALKVGMEKAVTALGRTDGYLKNNAVKIPLPERLRQMEGLLRKVGLGGPMDELVVSMNRAAEKAAPSAREIFADAIVSMSIQDAQGLLQGLDTAATDYFKRTTSPKLAEFFKPVVRNAMSQYGVTQKYQAVGDRYKTLPFSRNFPLPDIEGYVVQRSLDGLFLTVANEERAIRRDPAARITPILKQVFGGVKN